MCIGIRIFKIRQTHQLRESEILILRKRPDDISGRTEIQLSGVSIDNVEALASGENDLCPNGCMGPGGTAFFKRFRKKAIRLCAEMIHAQNRT